MTYISDTNLSLPVHDHPADQSCHWASILKSLAFIVFRDAQLMQKILHDDSGRFDASDFKGYARWLCKLGGNGILNLMNVLLRVCEVRGAPQLPALGGI
jgi:hypothetical protein